MSMASMYERIMGLPLFKGLGEAQISSFLEKTHLEFRNCKPGEIIVGRGERISKVMLLLSGRVKLSLKIENHDIYIIQKYSGGNVLCVERLFGMDTCSPYEIEALCESTVISFSKERYVNLLGSDNIFLINYLNYLSFRAQKAVDVPANIVAAGFKGFLASIVALFSDKTAEEIYVKGTEESFSKLTGISVLSIADDISSLCSRGIIDYSENAIMITDRHALITRL